MGDIDYQTLELPYQPPPAHDDRRSLVVVGAGPIGLTLALDMAERGHDVLLIDDNNHLSTGSRAICFSKRALDIWDRIGVGQRMVDKGVSWNIGKVFFRDSQVWQFDLLPERAIVVRHSLTCSNTIAKDTCTKQRPRTPASACAGSTRPWRFGKMTAVSH